MRDRIFRIFQILAIFGFVFIVAQNLSWANSHHASMTIKKKRMGKFSMTSDNTKGLVKRGTIDDYLEEKGINEVQITVEMTETETDSGTQLNFVFTPSDVYFSKPMDLKLSGEYVDPNNMAWLVDASGNVLPGELSEDGTTLTFKISNLSELNSDTSVVPPYAASYSVSKAIGVDGGSIKVNSEANIKIKRNALKDYLNEQGLDSVVISVELYYGWDRSLLFVFGPSGAHFDPDLELTIIGGYLEEDMTLSGEDGELLEYRLKRRGRALTFFIPHFSSYIYDHYDY